MRGSANCHGLSSSVMASGLTVLLVSRLWHFYQRCPNEWCALEAAHKQLLQSATFGSSCDIKVQSTPFLWVTFRLPCLAISCAMFGERKSSTCLSRMLTRQAACLGDSAGLLVCLRDYDKDRRAPEGSNRDRDRDRDRDRSDRDRDRDRHSSRDIRYNPLVQDCNHQEHAVLLITVSQRLLDLEKQIVEIVFNLARELLKSV